MQAKKYAVITNTLLFVLPSRGLHASRNGRAKHRVWVAGVCAAAGHGRDALLPHRHSAGTLAQPSPDDGLWSRRGEPGKAVSCSSAVARGTSCCGEAWSIGLFFIRVFYSWIAIHHLVVLLAGFRPRESWFHAAKLYHLGIHLLTPKMDWAEFV